MDFSGNKEIVHAAWEFIRSHKILCPTRWEAKWYWVTPANRCCGKFGLPTLWLGLRAWDPHGQSPGNKCFCWRFSKEAGVYRLFLTRASLCLAYPFTPILASTLLDYNPGVWFRLSHTSSSEPGFWSYLPGSKLLKFLLLFQIHG